MSGRTRYILKWPHMLAIPKVGQLDHLLTYLLKVVGHLKAMKKAEVRLDAQEKNANSFLLYTFGADVAAEFKFREDHPPHRRSGPQRKRSGRPAMGPYGRRRKRKGK